MVPCLRRGIPLPAPNTGVNTNQSFLQGRITLEGGHKQLDGDSIWPNNLSVNLRANVIYQPLYRGLDIQQCILGPLVKAFGDVQVKHW